MRLICGAPGLTGKRSPGRHSRSRAPELYHDAGNIVQCNRIPAISALTMREAPMICRRVFLRSAACAGMASLSAGLMASARADSYPSHPVRWVVPYAAGGATDVLSRLICQHLSERLGQPFIVENKPGAGSNIGTRSEERR